MKELLNIICPIILQLNIFQLEEYKPHRFLKWISKNFLTRKIQAKKPLIYTHKAKILLVIYTVLCTSLLFLNIYLFLILLTQPYIGLIIAILVLKPYEFLNKYRTIIETRNKVLSLNNLKVITITGSFGKSSTKEILYQILKTKYKVLRTPESFNTIFGIAKVVDLELDDSYKFFICEMAAYKTGEIKTLCNMVPPNFGVLTGITTQHLERFGSLENTVRAKFELIDTISDKNNVVFNLADKNILNELRKRNLKADNNQIIAKNIKFNKEGSNFDFVINQNIYKVLTPLFGSANVKNIIIAGNMALKLGIKENQIVIAIEKLKPFGNRNMLTKNGNLVVVNNTFSSNFQSFREMIETAKKIKGKKVLVTPGIVEMGSLEGKTHEILGREAFGVFQKIILVGRNKKTLSLAKGLGNNYEFIEDTRESYFSKIEEFKRKYDWIFLENDLTQNY